MNDDSERMIYTGLGPLAALALGMLLVPVRDFTTASNFTFLFLVLTIVVAEFGGRTAAVATALSAALSLDFFLTQPYLRLEIAGKHDLIAFVGLAVCGLVVAGLGARRGERRADLREARRNRDLLRRALLEMDAAWALDYRSRRVLDACRSALPVSALVLRDGGNRVVAASPSARPVPEMVLRQDDLLPLDASDREWHPRDLPASPGGGREALKVAGRDLLPLNVSDRDRERLVGPLSPEGGRVALTVAGRQVGWLDVWGARATASGDARRTLSDVARVMAAMLAGGPGTSA